MKTHEEQLDFAVKLKELTNKHNNLIKQLAESVDKQTVLLEIKSTAEQMDELRNSYMNGASDNE